MEKVFVGVFFLFVLSCLVGWEFWQDWNWLFFVVDGNEVEQVVYGFFVIVGVYVFQVYFDFYFEVGVVDFDYLFDQFDD